MFHWPDRILRLPYGEAILKAGVCYFNEDEEFVDLDDCIRQMPKYMSKEEAIEDVYGPLIMALQDASLTDEDLGLIRISYSIAYRKNQFLEMDHRSYLEFVRDKIKTVFGIDE